MMLIRSNICVIWLSELLASSSDLAYIYVVSSNFQVIAGVIAYTVVYAVAIGWQNAIVWPLERYLHVVKRDIA
jgi:hypothetical protein